MRKGLDERWGDTKHANGETPADVKARHGKASMVGSWRILGNMRQQAPAGGGVQALAKLEEGCVQFIGTHSQHEKTDAETE